MGMWLEDFWLFWICRFRVDVNRLELECDVVGVSVSFSWKLDRMGIWVLGLSWPYNICFRLLMAIYVWSVVCVSAMAMVWLKFWLCSCVSRVGIELGVGIISGVLFRTG